VDFEDEDFDSEDFDIDNVDFEEYIDDIEDEPVNDKKT